MLKRLITKTQKTYFIFPKLLIAAVVLFGLFLVVNFEQAFAFFGNSGKEQSLITEELLKAQFQEAEQRMFREGSYVYSYAVPTGRQGYQFLAQINDFDEGFGGGELSNNILVQGIAFLGSNNPSSNLLNSTGLFDRNRSGIVTYKVQPGDTPSYIAASFGISTNTLLWANNLNYWSIIKPGQELIILPTSGVLHRVKKGESLAAIVKKYKGDFEETISFNGLSANGFVKAGQEIIIPNGKKTIPVYYPPRPRVQFASYYKGPYSGKSRSFPWGQCTWYVAQKRYVPWGGHAKNWLTNAARMGYSVCWGRQCQPKAGSIIALAGNTWLIRLYGHVAYVEAVNGDWITFSEMNYLGLGIRSVRTIHKNDWRIRGYIY